MSQSSQLRIVDGKCALTSRSSKLSGRPARLAILKQDCLGDLWIGDYHDQPDTLILSTQMRVGPIAAISRLKADFFIIRYEFEEDTNYFQQQTPLSNSQIIATQKGRIEDIEKYLSTKSKRKHHEYSIKANEINWSNYDIVISINSCIPKSIRKRHQSTLWACMPGEGNTMEWRLSRLGYHCLLNHNWSTRKKPHGITIDFPYTFVEPKQFKKIQNIRKFEERKDIYVEINSCSIEFRPPKIQGITEASQLINNIDMRLKLHRGTVEQHIEDLATSLVFVKLGGRSTRGNAFAESIASGTPVLLRRNDCFGGLQLPEESYFNTIDDLATRLKDLKSNKKSWSNLIKKQKKALKSQGINNPLEQLCYAYNSRKSAEWRFRNAKHITSAMCHSLIHKIRKKRIIQLIFNAFK